MTKTIFICDRCHKEFIKQYAEETQNDGKGIILVVEAYRTPLPGKGALPALMNRTSAELDLCLDCCSVILTESCKTVRDGPPVTVITKPGIGIITIGDKE